MACVLRWVGGGRVGQGVWGRRSCYETPATMVNYRQNVYTEQATYPGHDGWYNENSDCLLQTSQTSCPPGFT